MMQTLRARDVLRCILQNVPKGPNLACPSQCLTGDKSVSNPILWKETLAQRRERVTVASWDGSRLAGLASARIRSGQRAWEVDRLFLACDAGDLLTGVEPFTSAPINQQVHGRQANANPNLVALELLEQIARETGQLRAERIFLRVSTKSRIYILARQAGFFPYYEENLLESSTPLEPQTDPMIPDNWSEAAPEDAFSLFQLYCAAIPQSVRAAVGMYFDQWQDSQEPLGHRQTWISKVDGKVLAGSSLSRRGQVRVGGVLAHPDNPELWGKAVDWALSQGKKHLWLVPDYQEMVSSLLLQRQFRLVSSYSVMIKMVAVPVARPGLVTVEA